MPISDLDVVILAAGNGSRLSSVSPLPKPLVAVEGRPLLDWVLAAVAEVGLEHATVVLGHSADTIRNYPLTAAHDLHLSWVPNRRYMEPNGISVLCAEHHVRTPFLLLMADHLFEVGTLRRFLAQSCPADGAVLAVDRKMDTVHDLSDAMKVVTRGGTVQAIGKTLAAYDAIDTGMFLCGQGLFDALRDAAASGKQALSDGVAVLAARGGVRAWDIGPGQWIDVDTPAALVEAERLVRDGCLTLTA